VNELPRVQSEVAIWRNIELIWHDEKGKGVPGGSVTTKPRRADRRKERANRRLAEIGSNLRDFNFSLPRKCRVNALDLSSRPAAAGHQGGPHHREKQAGGLRHSGEPVGLRFIPVSLTVQLAGFVSAALYVPRVDWEDRALNWPLSAAVGNRTSPVATFNVVGFSECVSCRRRVVDSPAVQRVNERRRGPLFPEKRK